MEAVTPACSRFFYKHEKLTAATVNVTISVVILDEQPENHIGLQTTHRINIDQPDFIQNLCVQVREKRQRFQRMTEFSKAKPEAPLQIPNAHTKEMLGTMFFDIVVKKRKPSAKQAVLFSMLLAALASCSAPLTQISPTEIAPLPAPVSGIPTEKSVLHPSEIPPAGPTDPAVISEAANKPAPAPEQIFGNGIGATRDVPSEEYLAWKLPDGTNVGLNVQARLLAVQQLLPSGVAAKVVESNGQWAVVGVGSDGSCYAPADASGNIVVVPYFRPDLVNGVTKYVKVIEGKPGALCTAVQIDSHWSLVRLDSIAAVAEVLRLSPDGSYAPVDKLTMIAETAVSHGATSNDAKTWTWDQAIEFQNIAFDPTHSSKEQLVRLYDFETALRKADFEKYIRDNYQDILNKDILGHFGREYMKNASWVDASKTLSQDQALEIVAGLTPQQRHDLEIVRRNINQENIRRSPWEIITSAEVPNNTFTKYTDYDNGKTIFYGLWAGDDITSVNVKKAINIKYGMNVLGQPITMTGIPLKGTAVVDFVGWGKTFVTPDNSTTPVEITTIVGRLKNASGGTKYIDIEVVTDTDQPRTVEATEFQSFYSDIFKNVEFAPSAFTITGSTIYALQSPDHRNFGPLTVDALTNQQSWPPTTVTIYKVNEEVFSQQNTSYMVSFLYDPLTGLPIIISSEKENSIPYHRGHAGLVFTGFTNSPTP